MDSYDAVRDMRIEEHGTAYRGVTSPPYRSTFGRLLGDRPDDAWARAVAEMDQRSSVGGDDQVAIGGE